ncbi:hypothetical protein OHR86_00210 [Streptomyces sp. NBC_00441]|uniref:hypothetical protein n=1 Tax=Streptomyces sp. NBC_00441 TaxID=2975742 RepID=UPI002E2DA066|nr:hypothetical protein [Streptomyces sp. NBC_00441]
MRDIELHEDLETAATLRAIICVEGPDEYPYAETIERTSAKLSAETVLVSADAPGDRAAMVNALRTALHLDHGPQPRSLADAEDSIVAERARAPRLVVVFDAHALRTTALVTLYGMWAHLVPSRFGLVLTGPHRKLERTLERPALASLQSCVHLHPDFPLRSDASPLHLLLAGARHG